MNKTLQVFRYVVLDFIGAAFAWGIFFIFRKTFLEAKPLQDEVIIQNESMNEVNTALEHLPQVQRDILVLSDWEGFESKEIAKMLSISDGAVRQNLLRARRFIKSEIANTL